MGGRYSMGGREVRSYMGGWMVKGMVTDGIGVGRCGDGLIMVFMCGAGAW